MNLLVDLVLLALAFAAGFAIGRQVGMAEVFASLVNGIGEADEYKAGGTD